jgi:hypothetical protein
MMAYRSDEHDPTGCTPNALMLGWEVVTPLDIMYQMPNDLDQVSHHQWAWELNEKLHDAQLLGNIFVARCTDRSVTMMSSWIGRSLAKETRCTCFSWQEKMVTRRSWLTTGGSHLRYCARSLTICTKWAVVAEVRHKWSSWIHFICGSHKFFVGKQTLIRMRWMRPNPRDQKMKMPIILSVDIVSRRQRNPPCWHQDYIL